MFQTTDNKYTGSSLDTTKHFMRLDQLGWDVMYRKDTKKQH